MANTKIFRTLESYRLVGPEGEVTINRQLFEAIADYIRERRTGSITAHFLNGNPMEVEGTKKYK